MVFLDLTPVFLVRPLFNLTAAKKFIIIEKIYLSKPVIKGGMKWRTM